MIALTSTAKFVDIDTLTCCFAMKHILSLQGINSDIVLSKNINHSVIKDMYEWFNVSEINELSKYDFTNKDVYLLDISDMNVVSKNIKIEQVKLVFDHLLGFEDQWINNNDSIVRIEKVGACATLVFEYIEELNLLNQISSDIAKLLYTTIIAHTQNLTTSITCERDTEASQKLNKIAKVPDSFISKYFQEMENTIKENISKAIENDAKPCVLLGKDAIYSQLEMWDGKNFIKENIETIIKTIEKYNKPMWLFSLLNISDKTSTIYTQSKELKLATKDIYTFKGNWGYTNKIVLRKELRKYLGDK